MSLFVHRPGAICWKLSATLDDWLVKHSSLARRVVIIPSSLKWEVRDKLDQANVNKRVLFPVVEPF